ncbi:hypothetical protein NLN86_23500 [Citrobacter portucalensis]|uniref:Uncharacterized protein n=1 Tax=Citrobacter portucalensis TaxID=1639133 RepID=A0AAW5WBP1_9ENTR|nr:hypothetical protein [Citrobacter portucalensis]MCX9004586.1 hypothetical protein [Citrobacter portucalensis]
MGMLVVFILSVVLCFFVTRGIYRKQLRLQPKGKLKAGCISGFVGIALFLVVNISAAVTLILDQPGTVKAGAAFDQVTAEKFATLYNDNLGGIEASKHEKLSALKIVGTDIKDSSAHFKTVDGAVGKAQLDEQGLLVNLLWKVKDTNGASLLSMGAAMEVLDSSVDRDEAINFLKQALAEEKDGSVKSSFESKRINYQLSKHDGTPLTLYIEPRY